MGGRWAGGSRCKLNVLVQIDVRGGRYLRTFREQFELNIEKENSINRRVL